MDKVKKIVLDDGTEVETQDLLDFSKIDEQDWRGLLAMTFIVGYFASIVACVGFGQIEMGKSIASTGIALLGIIIRDYFEAKKK